MQGNLTITCVRLIISTLFIVGMAYKDVVGALVHGPPICVWDELIIPHKHSTGGSLYVEIVFMMGDSLYMETN